MTAPGLGKQNFRRTGIFPPEGASHPPHPSGYPGTPKTPLAPHPPDDRGRTAIAPSQGCACHRPATLGISRRNGCPKRLGGRTFDLIAVLAFPVGRSKSAPCVVYPVTAITSPSGRAPLDQVEAGVELAHRWAEGLQRGRWKSLGDIARIHEVSVARVSQLLPLSHFTVPNLMAAARSMKRPSLRKLIVWARQHTNEGDDTRLIPGPRVPSDRLR